jgi:hypothetical protein
MRWRDSRFELPEEKDGSVIVKDANGREWIVLWSDVGKSEKCWTPTSELPQPGLPGPIPDGWRPVDKAVDAFDTRSMLWLGGKWQPTQAKLAWDRDYYYIVPVNPPEPQYRPFANAAEFMPHADRWLKEKLQEDFRATVCAFNDKGFWISGAMVSTTYADGFCIFEFADGTPFGVLINS